MKKLRWFQSFRKISGLRTPVCLKPNKKDMFAQKSSFICLFLSKQVDFWLKITIFTENYHYFSLLEIFKPLRGRNDDFSVDETSLVELISCNGSENGNFYWFCHFWTKLGIFEQKTRFSVDKTCLIRQKAFDRTNKLLFLTKNRRNSFPFLRWIKNFWAQIMVFCRWNVSWYLEWFGIN